MKIKRLKDANSLNKMAKKVPENFRSFYSFFFSFSLQASGGGYNGLSSIKMEQDGMAPIGSMKVGLAFFSFFPKVVPKVHYDMCSCLHSRV